MDGLKEGDYLVAVGDTDCKWMGVSEVMKLLKDVDEEGIDIKVISMIDSSIQAMVTFLTSSCLKEQLEQLLYFLNRLWLGVEGCDNLSVQSMIFSILHSQNKGYYTVLLLVTGVVSLSFFFFFLKYI